MIDEPSSNPSPSPIGDAGFSDLITEARGRVLR